MRVIRTLVSVSYVCPLLITLIGLPYSRAYAKDQSPADDGAKASVDGEEREERYSKMEDLGIDLVITKVRTTRGDWSEGDVQIVTYVKNMCNSHVTQLIKVN
jgi:hypothetical protein